MLIHDIDHAHLGAASKPEIPLEVRKLTSRAGSLVWAGMRVYTRTAGCLQILYAVVVGGLAFGELSSLVHDIVYYGKPIGKGVGPISPRLADLVFFAIFSGLFLTSFIGGYGLLRIRPWARRWEMAYLGVVLLVVAGSTVAMLSGALPTPWEFDAVAMLDLIIMAFALPYLPVLVTRWLDVAFLPSNKACSKIALDVLDDLPH